MLHPSIWPLNQDDSSDQCNFNQIEEGRGGGGVKGSVPKNTKSITFIFVSQFGANFEIKLYVEIVG